MFIDQPHRRYTWMNTTRLLVQKYKEITIRPFRSSPKTALTKGFFVYQVIVESDDEGEFYDIALANMRKFLNYLTYHHQHGFREMDNFFHCNEPISDEDLFDIKNLPSIRVGSILPPGKPWSDISNDVQQSLKEVENILLPPTIQKKIDSALSLYRNAFFQYTEEMCLTLQFIALEALTEKSDSKFDRTLITDISEAVKCVCKRRNVPPKNRQRIRSHIGRLSDETIRDMMRNTLQKYNIDIREGNKKVDIGKMYDSRCKFVHEGKEIKDCHKLCMKMEKIIPALVKQLVEK